MWRLPRTSGSAMHVWASRARVDVPRVPYGRRPRKVVLVNTERPAYRGPPSGKGELLAVGTVLLRVWNLKCVGELRLHLLNYP